MHPKKYYVGTFKDLQKAFGKVDHGIILKKLQQNGFRMNCI